jgi:hypothetical protein
MKGLRISTICNETATKLQRNFNQISATTLKNMACYIDDMNSTKWNWSEMITQIFWVLISISIIITLAICPIISGLRISNMNIWGDNAPPVGSHRWEVGRGVSQDVDKNLGFW